MSGFIIFLELTLVACVLLGLWCAIEDLIPAAVQILSDTISGYTCDAGGVLSGCSGG